jgi:X-Pro dipeptidyl-peptidase
MRQGLTLAVVLVLLGLPGAASAAPPLGPDGETAATYDYTAAIRERVLIPQPGIDQDANGVDDTITIDIIRPSESGPANKIPAIIDPSPYYTTVCRGMRGECMGDVDGDGVNDRWPLFLDNYFVPRGYAVILGQMNGTGVTTSGCPKHGGPGDIAGEKSIIDWLNGRVAGVAAPNWHNGKAAMIGKSYDGTLANGVAATGVAGLTTIVPESAISDWYDYSRSNGIRTVGTNYPTGLNGQITDAARRALCNTAVNNGFNTIDGDETGDRNAFWEERNYRPNVSHVQAAVFAVHGFQDDNVKMDQLWPWWNGLKAAGVPRKLWLLRSGHTDPFDARRGAFVDTLHRWFDHWLYGIDNGIMSEPPVTIEDEKDVWGEYGDWPIPGTSNVDVFLQGTTTDAAGVLRGTSGGPLDSVAFTGNGAALNGTISSTVETQAMTAPTGAQTGRRVFLSRPLATDVRLSGQASIDLRAWLDTTQSNLGAILVDYSATPFTEVSRNNDGLTYAAGSATTCWGASSTYDNPCYLDVTKPTQSVTQWRVTRGILDSSNRDSLTTAATVTPGQQYTFTIPLEPTEHTFKAGHQIGVVIVGNLFGIAGTPNAGINVNTKLSKLVLPVAGGAAAARASALTDETAPSTAAAVSPAPNAAGWYREKPTITLTADDGDGSGPGSYTYTVGAGAPETVNGAEATVPISAEGETTVHYAATDRAGNSDADHQLTVKVDTLDPEIACPADSAWHRENVTVTCTASDTGSGVGNPSVAARTAAPAGAEGTQTAATPSVCDAAGNCAVGHVTRRIDRRAPGIVLTHPATTTFARGAVVPLTHACTDGGSGIATCSGPSTLDTSHSGTVTVRATDKVGNAASQSWSYTVLGTLPKLSLKARKGRKLALTSSLGVTVKITGGVRPVTVKLQPGVTRVVTLKPKSKRAKKVSLKLVSSAGSLRRTELKTVSLRR